MEVPIGKDLKPVLVKNLSVGKLRRAVAEAEEDVIRKRAQALGQRIRGEDGVGQKRLG